ncbi:coiled-coil domain-containing protein [Yersinia proxima]|uniref:hypothetical protein n=1 Tax=Yersinia proxima TaxID=2890316 RepID=UPI001D12E1EC|nr:hypothetical protein [Yersinia proxima]
MADENTGLVVIDIKPESYPTLYIPNGLDSFLDQIRQEVSEVPDLSTAKGRARVASLAASVSSSKAAIEKPGRDYLKKLKEAVKPAEAEIKRFVDACNALRDETRRPLTEWEAEQERLKQEAEAKKKAEELAAEIEVAHEMALLMNDAFDRDAKEKAEEVERLRKAHEELIAQQAAEKAKREAEEKAKRDIEAAEQRERDAKLAQERAEREKQEATELAERNRIAAEQKAEREKREAIAAEQRKAQEEASRIKREAQQKEDARLAEEKRVADEAAARAANVEHKRTINQQAVADLVAAGIPEECAVQCVKAIAKGQVSAIAITY